MRELIYERAYGGKWSRVFSCFGDTHIWRKEGENKTGNITITKEQCMDCNRIRILLISEKWTY